MFAMTTIWKFFLNSTIMSGFYWQFLTGDIYTQTGDSRETYSHL